MLFLGKNILQFMFVFYYFLNKYFFNLKISPFGLISFEKPFIKTVQNLTSELDSPALLPFYLIYNVKTSGAITLQKYFGNYY